MVVAPDLINADERDVIVQRVSPATPGNAKRIPNARRQNAKQFIAGGQIEIAAKNHRNTRGNLVHLAREPFELFALMFSIRPLFPSAIRRPQIRADAVGM